MNKKTELRLMPHEMLPGHFVIEAWYEGRLVCTMAGRDGPGIRVISKHHLSVKDVVRNPLLNIIEIEVRP